MFFLVLNQQCLTWTASAGMLAASDERSKHDTIFSRSANPAILRLFSGFTFCQSQSTHRAHSEYKHSLTFRVRCYVVIATKPVHWLQVCPVRHN